MANDRIPGALPRDPKDIMAITQCGNCGGVQGAFHLVEEGTLVLGLLLCETCGTVGRPRRVHPARRPIPTVDAIPRVHIELDDEEYRWPMQPSVGEEQFG